MSRSDLLHEKPRRRLAETASIDGNTRQSRRHMFGLVDIVESDDCEILAHNAASIAQGVDRADRYHIAEAQSRGGGLLELEALAHEGAAAVAGRQAFDDKRRFKGDFRVLQRIAVAGNALLPDDHPGQSAKKRNTAMTKFNEM